MVTNALLRAVSIPTVISAIGCKQDLGPLLAGTVKASESLAAQFPTGHLNSNELFPATADYTACHCSGGDTTSPFYHMPWLLLLSGRFADCFHLTN